MVFRRRERMKGYLYVAPALAWLVLVFLYPIMGVIRNSLTSGSWGSAEFVGLRNYLLVLRDPLFSKAVLNNVLLLATVPVSVFLGLICSTLLYDRVVGWRVYRVVVFIPVVLAVAAVGIIFGEILQFHGLLNESLARIGLGFLAQDWLGSSKFALWSIAAIIVWKEAGFGTVLFLARLMSVEQELYETAKLDGASWWQLLRHVTIPQLSSVIEFYTVLEVIVVFCWVFDYVFVITYGGPMNSTIVGEFFIYKYAFAYQRPDIASVVAVTYLVGSLILMSIRHVVTQRLEA